MVTCSRVSALLVVCLGFCMSTAPSAHAQALPQVNLGLTSFLDGAPPAGPGFYYQAYFQYFHSDRITDQHGDTVVFPGGSKPDLNTYALLNQFIYQSDQKILFEGMWGIDVIVPLVKANLGPDSLPIHDNSEGLGDVVIGPFLQWDPIMLDERPFFFQRVEFQMITPTGKYDNDKAVNPGSNFFSIDPYWSGTVLLTPQWEFSTRIHYLWNDENNDPNLGLAGKHKSRAGQAIHLNFASSYELIEKTLRAGINGYYLRQITDSSIDGQSVSGSKEQVFGLGPGVLWSINQDNHIFLNAYYEMAAQNWPQGMRYVLRWTHHF